MVASAESSLALWIVRVSARRERCKWLAQHVEERWRAGALDLHERDTRLTWHSSCTDLRMLSPSTLPRLLACVVWLTLPGCGGALADMVAAVPRPVIEESLDTLDDPRTQEAIAAVVSSPEYRDATSALLGNVTDGTLDALSDEDRRARLAELSEAFVSSMAASMGRAMRTELGPAVASAVAATMDRVLQRVLSEESREQLALMVAHVAHEAVVALAAAVRDDLGPAVRELLTDEEVSRALTDTTRHIARDVVIGINEGLREVERRDERGAQPATLLSSAQDFAMASVPAATIGLAIVSVLLVGYLFFARARARTLLSESNRRELALLSVLSAMKAAEGKPWGGELRAILRESFRDNEDAEYLREVLRKNRHLRMADANGHDAR